MRILDKLVHRRDITAILAAVVLLTTGCVMGPKFKTPVVPTADQWREMGQPQFTGQPVDQVEWWKSLNDPILNSLIEQAFAQNLTGGCNPRL